VYSYATGKLVGTIQSNVQLQEGLCSDKNGDVFIVGLESSGSGEGLIYEYAHGGLTPIATLEEPNVWPYGCSVDPTTGDLAVASVNWVSFSSYLDVYKHARGTPHEYYDPKIINYEFCGYDNHGDLFVDGTGSGSDVYFAEVPKGSNTFINYSLSKAIGIGNAAEVQWDGTHITLEDANAGAIYQLALVGSTARIVRTTHLKQWSSYSLSWISGRTALAANGTADEQISVWRYPGGGKPIAEIDAPASILGVTVSRGPRR
jgi:hypothetical protein